MATLEQQLREWTLTEAYDLNVIETKAGLPDVINVELITWPDGSDGVFTTTDYLQFPYRNLINGFRITHEDSGFVVIRPNIFVTSNGDIASESLLYVGLPIFGFGVAPFGEQPFGA